MRRKGVLIVIDGIGGCGKTTLANALVKRLGKRALYTHEPGGAPYAEKIRDILLKGLGPVANPLADFFLFWAARAEHVRDRILPALGKGRVVVSDRFDSSTFAFQVVAEKNPELAPLFWEARKATLGRAIPDLYLILDVPVSTAALRRAARPKVKDRFDERERAYQARVRAGFRRFAREVGPKKAVVIDASGTLEEAETRAWKLVEGTLLRCYNHPHAGHAKQ